MGALTGFVYLAEQGWQLAGIISFATELALTAFSARFFALWMSRDAAPEQRDLAALLGIGALGCSCTIPLPLGVSLGAVLCTGVVLWCARYARNFTCAAASLGLGLCLDLAAGGGCAYAAALGVGGLLRRRRLPLGAASGGDQPAVRHCGGDAVELAGQQELCAAGERGAGVRALSGPAPALAGRAGKAPAQAGRKAPPVAEQQEPERQAAEARSPPPRRWS